MCVCVCRYVPDFEFRIIHHSLYVALLCYLLRVYAIDVVLSLRTYQLLLKAYNHLNDLTQAQAVFDEIASRYHHIPLPVYAYVVCFLGWRVAVLRSVYIDLRGTNTYAQNTHRTHIYPSPHVHIHIHNLSLSLSLSLSGAHKLPHPPLFSHSPFCHPLLSLNALCNRLAFRTCQKARDPVRGLKLLTQYLEVDTPLSTL
jgi:hypothetical protein